MDVEPFNLPIRKRRIHWRQRSSEVLTFDKFARRRRNALLINTLR
jgi:hypothetical protein